MTPTIAEQLAELGEGPLAAMYKRKNKYRNKKVIDVDGEKYDSRKERKRWNELKLLEDAGIISHLTRIRRECTFYFALNGVKICSYVADAVYKENGERVVEDTKSEFTRKNAVYRIKKKLMKAFYNITVKEV